MVFSPQQLLRQLQLLLAPHLSQNNDSRTMWLACSGGLDSHVLLHAMAELRPALEEWNIRAIHIDHGLRPEAGQWAAHCQQVCQQLDVPCSIMRVQVDKVGEGLEAAARYARYQIFADMMQKGDVLLTAHHADDQAETFMLQTLRGSGPRGMSAMPAAKPFADGLLLRPLLNFRRQALEDYAAQQGLDYIHDPSNDETCFDRNFLRHEIMPALKTHWPSVVEVLGRDARQQAEAAALLDVLAEQDLVYCKGTTPGCLDLSKLAGLDENRQRNLVRFWLRQHGLALPQRRKLNEVLRSMLQAGQDRQPLVDWPGGEVRRFRGQMYAGSVGPAPPKRLQSWDLQAPLVLPGQLGTLSVQENGDQGLDPGVLRSAPVRIGFRRGGERCQPAGRGHHHSLKKLFQEAAIPPWQRERTPLVYVGEELAQIVGVCICEPFKAKSGHTAVNIIWQR